MYKRHKDFAKFCGQKKNKKKKEEERALKINRQR